MPESIENNIPPIPNRIVAKIGQYFWAVIIVMVIIVLVYAYVFL